MPAFIRTVRPDDAAALCRISTVELGYSCEEELVRAHIATLDPEREAVFVAECGTKDVVGYCHVERYRVLYFSAMANILGLAVSAPQQRQGIGSALLAAAERWAQERGLTAVRLNSGIGRSSAHEFYRKSGYIDEKMQLRFLKRRI